MEWRIGQPRPGIRGAMLGRLDTGLARGHCGAMIHRPLPTAVQSQKLGLRSSSSGKRLEDARKRTLLWKAFARFPEGNRRVRAADGVREAELLSDNALAKN